MFLKYTGTFDERPPWQEDHLIIILYIYDALINALSAHVIRINLNMIFYTSVEHSPTKTIYIKSTANTHTHTYTDCSRNWVLILVRMEIL